MLRAQSDGDHIPDNLKLRANSAPAGTAVITTSAAALEAMEATGIVDALKAAGVKGIEEIRAVAEEIRADPTAYHRTVSAYGRTPMTVEAASKVEKARVFAARLAPITQGFIDGVMANAALSRARALRKHAEDNPVQLRRATMYFRHAIRRPVERIRDIVAPEESAVRTVAAANPEFEEMAAAAAT